MAIILPSISTFFIALSALAVATGWYLIAKKKIAAHKKAMSIAAILATLFFATYLSKTFFIGSTSFGGPEEVTLYYHIFLIIHITLATIAAFLGLVTLYTGYKTKVKKHRKLGPITSVIWFFSASSGIAVYLLLYVIYPNGDTTNLFQAILGG